jgi:hypothetical protein
MFCSRILSTVDACLLLDKGRLSLYKNGENEKGYCEPFLEAGVQHFYDWMYNKIKPL